MNASYKNDIVMHICTSFSDLFLPFFVVDQSINSLYIYIHTKERHQSWYELVELNAGYHHAKFERRRFVSC